MTRKASNPYNVSKEDIKRYKRLKEPGPVLILEKDMELVPMPKIEIKPGEPIRLIPGSIYVIESEMALTISTRDRIIESLEKQFKDYDIKFLILDGGLKLVKRDCESSDSL